VKEIVEIEKVEVNFSLSKEEKMEKFVREIKNPYKIKAYDIIVNVVFDKNGPDSLE